MTPLSWNSIWRSAQLIAVAATLFNTSSPTASAANCQAQLSESTRRAIELFQQNRTLEAIELEENAIKQKPADWAAHAVASFFMWNEGDFATATAESEKSLALAPRNKTVLINLAQMKEGIDDLAGAIPLYERARKLAPLDWRPGIGLARCYVKSGHEDRALAVLDQMSQKTDGDFAWSNELGDAYLKINKPSQAVAAFTKAAKLAGTATQQSSVSTQLMLALIRNNDLERAKAIEEQVFDGCGPTDSELYVRTALVLLASTDPEAGAKLFSKAQKNLTTVDDAEAFFQLGNVFRTKAREIATDSNSSIKWLALAENAYRQAITIDSLPSRRQSRYHLGLAGVLQLQGEHTKMADELRTTSSLDPSNLLPSFLLAHSGAQNTVANVHLSKISFKIEGLDCGCRLSRVQQSFSHIPGLAFLYIAPNTRPYEGCLLIDESQPSPTESVLTAMVRQSLASTKLADKLDSVHLTISDRQGVSTIDQSIQIAQTAMYGEKPQFYAGFKAVSPVMPVTITDNKATDATKNQNSQSSLDPLTKQALLRLKEDKISEALEVEEKALQEQPNNWAAHATMSYLQWQQGDLANAIMEEEQAAKLAPDNETVLTNLGHLQQAFVDYPAAIQSYTAAHKIAPKDWRPLTSIARCQFKNGQRDEALATLQGMLQQSSGDFDWFYEVSKAYLQFNDSRSASVAAGKAMHQAKTAEQKRAGAEQLLLSLLRNNEASRARAVASKYHLLEKGAIRDSELCVRAAVELLSPDAPDSGRELLQGALNNFQEPEDCDVFFRLGRVFQQKAQQSAPSNGTSFGAWMDNAVRAYKQAAALNPANAGYHLALAGALALQEDIDGMKAELSQAQSLSKSEPVIGHLLSELVVGGPARTATGTNLTKVHCSVNGLTCLCQISRVESTFTAIKGVAFAHLTHQEAPAATLLVDESVASVQTILDQCSAKAFSDLPPKPHEPMPIVKFANQSVQPRLTVAEVVHLGEEMTNPPVTRFYHIAKDDVPVLPITITEIADQPQAQ